MSFLNFHACAHSVCSCIFNRTENWKTLGSYPSQRSSAIDPVIRSALWRAVSNRSKIHILFLRAYAWNNEIFSVYWESVTISEFRACTISGESRPNLCHSNAQLLVILNNNRILGRLWSSGLVREKTIRFRNCIVKLWTTGRLGHTGASAFCDSCRSRPY